MGISRRNKAKAADPNAPLTADSILQEKFSVVKFREGYDQDEVDEFLDKVVKTLREVEEENKELKAKLSE